MYGIILISTLVASSLAAASNSADLSSQRIVGGSAANLELFSYHVSLRSNNLWHLCSGSIIDSRWIVTSAYCASLAGDDFRIAADTTSAFNGGQEIRVANIYQHPEFDPVSLNNDIAILELEQDLVFGPTVKKLDLPAQDQSVVIGAFANITGWGRIYEGGNFPAVLLASYVNIVSQEDCREVYGDAITDSMTCAGRPDGSRGACEGDEGGPLVISNVLIGVVSWISVCGREGIPEVYASVPALRSFIAEVTGL